MKLLKSTLNKVMIFSCLTVFGIVAQVNLGAVTTGGFVSVAKAQDMLPTDNWPDTYHKSPRYRESESHPLRLVAYILHPIGWALREGITRPISYFASSTETRRSVMGFTEPFEYRSPECFSPDDSGPDCRVTMPFNYSTMNLTGADAGTLGFSPDDLNADLDVAEVSE